MKRDLTGTSKFLSYVLRHRPDEIGVELDPAGWARVAELLDACRRHGTEITREELEEVVATSDKQRFSFSPDGERIRANQGHSVAVDLGLEPLDPPALLYHGTVTRFLDSIRKQGLVRKSRQHVHLSPDEETARRVGMRRGRPVVLVIEAGRMRRDGYVFYVSANGVWLIDAVPQQYIRLPGPEMDGGRGP
ncbi:MAG: RNA 2'-phosphotransferase [Planctomycetota bacterium]|jgi:putative RNA 2'-phosphotransferase